MDKRPMGYIPGKGNPLDKKPPASKKYQNVKSKLEGKTGMTVKDVTLMSDQHVAKRKGEQFLRVKPHTLAKLMMQETNQESIYNLTQDQQEEEKYNYPQQQQQQQYGDSESIYSFVTAQTNVTQISQITSATEQLGINDDTTFLLLDLRENDDFNKFNIKESINYPAPNISRDKIIPQIQRFKNKENKMIIIYHLDERNTVPFGNLLFQKGYDNIYVLTGGIESFMQEFPQLIEGNQIPNIPQIQDGDKKKKLVKRQNHKEYPDQGMKMKKDERGDMIANQIIQNQQSSSLSQANQSDISSVQGMQAKRTIQNKNLTNQNLQKLGGSKK